MVLRIVKYLPYDKVSYSRLTNELKNKKNLGITLPFYQHVCNPDIVAVAEVFNYLTISNIYG